MSTETNHGTEGIVAPNPERELTYGEKAAGLAFNAIGNGRAGIIGTSR